MEAFTSISLFTALLMFVLKIWFERSAIRAAIMTDMKNLLGRARDTLEYLDTDTHYWLKVGDTLTRAPTDVPVQINAYQSLLTKLYLLGPKTLTRILSFYSHYHYCDGLKVALFNNLKDHVEAKRPLEDTDVQILNARRERVCVGLKSLLDAEDAILRTRPTELPDAYPIPTTRETANLVNSAVGATKGRVLLPK